MNKLLPLLLLLLPLISTGKEYQVKIHIKNLPTDSKPLLLKIYNGNTYIVDSLPTLEDNVIQYRIPATTAPGMLRAVLGLSVYAKYTNGQPTTIDFLFNRENVELTTDFEKPLDSLQVIQSKENLVFLDFQKADALFFQKLGLLEQVLANYPDKDEFYKKAIEYYKKFLLQRDKFIDKVYSQNQNSLAGKIIHTKKVPLTAGDLPPAVRDSIFRTQFLETIEFNDTTLLHTSAYTDKVYQFIQMFMRRDASPRENEANIIKAVDLLVPRLDVNPIVQQHLMQFLIAGFEMSKLEEVLAHISTNYLQQCGGSEEIVKKRLENYKKMAVGNNVPDFTVMDIDNNPVNLYNLVHPYKLIIFWHTDCSHCKLLMEELPDLIKQEYFKKHQIKIIGISIDENRKDWEKFSAEHQMDWVNTHVDGGFDNETSAAYNLFATPSMFLVDDNNKIIAKPTTIEELKDNTSKL